MAASAVALNPSILVSPPDEERNPPPNSSHASASIDHSFLHAVPLDEGNLHALRKTTNETMSSRVQVCKAKTEKAHAEAKKANVQLKKKTFIIKLTIAIIASVIFLGSLAGTAASGGVATPATVGFGGIAILAISDACCAYKDWKLSKAGREGLPMGANGLGNGLHWLMKLLPMQEDTRLTAAKWSSLIVKTIITLGILGVTDFSANVSMDNNTISTPLMTIGGALSDLAVTHAEKNKATEQQVSQLDCTAHLSETFENEVIEAHQNLSNAIKVDSEQEKEFIEKAEKHLQALRDKEHKLRIELQRKKLLQQQCLKFVDCIPEHCLQQLEAIKLCNTLKQTQPTAPRESSSTSHFDPTQFQLQKVAPAPVPAATATTAQKHFDDAMAAAEEFKTNCIKHAKSTFIVKVIRSVCLAGGLSPISLFISIGDAKHAYNDWQLKKQGKTGLPFGSDWIANKEYQRMRNNNKTDAEAKKRANRVSMGVRLFFTLGAILPTGEQHCVVEGLTNAVCGVETLMSPMLDEAEDDDELDGIHSEAELEQSIGELSADVLHNQVLAASAHKVKMEGILHRWRGSKERIQARIDKNAAKLADIKTVIDKFQSQAQQMVNAHRSELEELLEGDVAKLFEEFMPITTISDNGESETTV